MSRLRRKLEMESAFARGTHFTHFTAQFTCFTSTASPASWERSLPLARGVRTLLALGALFTCCTSASTKVQMLTQQHVRRQLTRTTRRISRSASGSARSLTRYSLYLRYWYKSLLTSLALSFSEWQRAFADEVLTLLALLVQQVSTRIASGSAPAKQVN
jgi:hypothetical protein